MSTPQGNTARSQAGYTPVSAFLYQAKTGGANGVVLTRYAFTNNGAGQGYVNTLLVIDQSDSGAGEQTIDDTSILMLPGVNAVSVNAFIRNIQATGGHPIYLWIRTAAPSVIFNYSKIYTLVVN